MNSTPPALPNTLVADELQAVQQLHQHYQNILRQMGGVIVGLEDVIEQLLVVLLCRGHGILEGVPGLAKTQMVSTLASLLGMKFRRIQFTPDLMPSDITGTEILEEDHTTGKRVFKFMHGPIFGNIILADEINRTPPKTQSAMLEAMQERQITVGGATYKLPDPFFVLATQNPIEQEGTYTLPEAQLDRFMLKIEVDYPSRSNEIEIVKRVTTDYGFQPQTLISSEEILAMQRVVRKVPVADHVYEFAVDLSRYTRPRAGTSTPFIREMVNWGAGPRASICLILAAKARAILHGRYHTTTEDVSAMALPVLRHRIVPTFNAEASGKDENAIVTQVLEDLKKAARKVA
ncbi:MAG: AAA family ATPase [Verrucomicrobiales bacterium]